MQEDCRECRSCGRSGFVGEILRGTMKLIWMGREGIARGGYVSMQPVSDTLLSLTLLLGS